MLTNVNADTTGILLSKYYGSKSYKSLNLTYYNGFITNGLIFLFSMIFYVRLDLVLMACGFSDKTSEIAERSILSIVPF